MFHLRKLKADGMDKNACVPGSLFMYPCWNFLYEMAGLESTSQLTMETLFFVESMWSVHPVILQWLGLSFCSNVQPFCSKIKWSVQDEPCLFGYLFFFWEISWREQVLDGIALSKSEQQQADEKFSGKAGSNPRWGWRGTCWVMMKVKMMKMMKKKKKMMMMTMMTMMMELKP